MRGLDFRGNMLGMCLIINKSFPTARAAAQGLGRVGRYGENCVRQIIKDVKLVDGPTES
jgi:hypothetical protein